MNVSLLSICCNKRLLFPRKYKWAESKTPTNQIKLVGVSICGHACRRFCVPLTREDSVVGYSATAAMRGEPEMLNVDFTAVLAMQSLTGHDIHICVAVDQLTSVSRDCLHRKNPGTLRIMLLCWLL